MRYDIKELRESTGMTQIAFSEAYGIPVSTLRKWEQKEAAPAPYVINLLARALPITDASLKKIQGKMKRYIIMIMSEGLYQICGETEFISRKIWKM